MGIFLGTAGLLIAACVSILLFAKYKNASAPYYPAVPAGPEPQILATSTENTSGTDPLVVPEVSMTPPAVPQHVEETKPLSKRERLYAMAFSCIGLDMCNDPAVPNEVQCAASVNAVFKKCFGTEIGGHASTQAMGVALRNDPRFAPTHAPQPGDIIISPTGSSSLGAPHGHVGIVGKNHVMSNNSNTGRFDTVYTLDSWHARYAQQLGFPVLFYTLMG